MTDIVLMKAAGGVLVPADQQAADYIAKLKMGTAVTATVRRQRNPKFHRKFFALLNFAFDAWEPAGNTYKGQQVGKNFDQFRNDVVVLAGHYEMAVTLKGDTRLTAKSISFGSMGEDEFEELYGSTINVVLQRILTNYTREDLDHVINQLLAFA